MNEATGEQKAGLAAGRDEDNSQVAGLHNTALAVKDRGRREGEGRGSEGEVGEVGEVGRQTGFS